MNITELIQKLQEADPSGEVQVVVNNRPIYHVENLEAYWDGKLQMLVQDHNKDPYYNVVGYKVTSWGRKVRLEVMDLEDVLLSDPDLPVDLSELTDQGRAMWQETVDAARKETKEIIAKVDAEEEA